LFYICASFAACLSVLLLVQVTTDVPLGSGQYWDIINLSADSHPIHLHNVEFQVR
jgi:FtsP/CotA-like multicopper oxidase with cupredoxin domain